MVQYRRLLGNNDSVVRRKGALVARQAEKSSKPNYANGRLEDKGLFSLKVIDRTVGS